MAPGTVTLIEAARTLGLAPSTLRWQVRKGRLSATKVGRDLHIDPAEVERYRTQVQRRQP
jgi:excisionase family DNA binding protein